MTLDELGKWVREASDVDLYQMMEARTKILNSFPASKKTINSDEVLEIYCAAILIVENS